MTASSSRAEERVGGTEFLANLRSRHTIIVAVSILAVTLLGALIMPTIIRPSVTAETRLVVGDQTLGAQTVPGYAQATITLAETYARFITIGAMKKAGSGTLTEVAATVIPDNPIIRVQATAGNSKDALTGAAAAAQALIKSVNQVSGGEIVTSRDTFVSKLTASTQADAAVIRLKHLVAYPEASNKLKSEYYAAVTAAALARIEADAYKTVLQNQLAAGKNQNTGLTVIMAPQASTANKKPTFLGALLGGGLAILGWGAASTIGQARRRDQARFIQ